MIKPDVIEKTPLNVVQLKSELNTIKKRDGELSFRGNKTEEYVNSFATITQKAAKELFDKIKALDIPRFKEEYIHKIIDTMPENVNHLKIVLQGYTVTVSPDNMKKIAAIVEEYKPKKKPTKADAAEKKDKKA